MVPREVRELIRIMSRENPMWGAPRIHGELLKLGIDILRAAMESQQPRRSRPTAPKKSVRSHGG
jgi:putative transposase